MARTAQVRAEVTYGADAYGTPTWAKDMDPWTIKLRYCGRQLTVPFYTGIGCRDHGTGEPTARGVMECLLSDANAAECSASVDDFAEDLGFTKPSDAIRAWKGCQKVHRQLKRLLGTEFKVALEDPEAWLEVHAVEEV